MMKNQIEISHNPDQILVEKSEFEAQQQQLGKLAAIETVERELRAEIRSMNERNAQLEASSASGWTEARASKRRTRKNAGRAKYGKRKGKKSRTRRKLAAQTTKRSGNNRSEKR